MTPDERRPIILARARANPLGLTPYRFTKGMTKLDALQFWNDAKALGLVTVGISPRGAKMLALPWPKQTEAPDYGEPEVAVWGGAR